MSDCAKSTSPPPPADWTDDGIFRAVFLHLFPLQDREVLQRAGAILASQAVSGDTSGHPVYGALAAASEELRTAERLLLEIGAMPEGSVLTPDESEACGMASRFAREIGDRASEVAAWADDSPDVQPDTPLGDDVREAERIARRLADHHPDPEVRRIYRQLAERAAAKGKP